MMRYHKLAMSWCPGAVGPGCLAHIHHPLPQLRPDYSKYVFHTGDNVTLGAHDWPTSLPPGRYVHKLALRNVQLHAPSGRYVALYDGDGTLDFNVDAKVG